MNQSGSVFFYKKIFSYNGFVNIIYVCMTSKITKKLKKKFNTKKYILFNLMPLYQKLLFGEKGEE